MDNPKSFYDLLACLGNMQDDNDRDVVLFSKELVKYNNMICLKLI